MPINQFKARAEYERTAAILHGKLKFVGDFINIKNGDVEARMPALLCFEYKRIDLGVEIIFSTYLSLEDVLEIIDTIPDSKVMHESLNFAEHYTGVRWNLVD